MGRRWDKNKLNNAVLLRQPLQPAEKYTALMFRYAIYKRVAGHVKANKHTIIMLYMQVTLVAALNECMYQISLKTTDVNLMVELSIWE